MGDPPKEEAPPFEPNAQSSPETDSEGVPYAPELLRPSLPNPSHEQVLQDLDARDALLSDEHREAAAHALGFESAEQRDEVDPPYGTIKKLEKDILRLEGITRTVGDRVTLIYEKLDVYTAVLYGIDRKLSELLAMVAEDPGIEVETELTLLNGADPTPVPEPEPPKRRHRRSKKEIEAEAQAQAPEPEAPFQL